MVLVSSQMSWLHGLGVLCTYLRNATKHAAKP